MDGSGSELRAFFNMIDISKQLIALLNIGPRNAHVAQVRFASTVRSRIDYPFNKYYNKQNACYQWDDERRSRPGTGHRHLHGR
jgi:hypothetical protein